jgi:hypothetical protein
LVAVAALLYGNLAMAQEPVEATKEVPKQPPASAAEETDHDKFVGSFAVGFLGARSVPIADNPDVVQTAGKDGHGPTAEMEATKANVAAPVIGARYWFTRTIGLDFGFGVGLRKGSATYTKYEKDPDNPNYPPMKYTFDKSKINQTGFVIHAGVPLALGVQKHFSFLVVPELDVGFSTGTAKFEVDQPPSSGRDYSKQSDIKLSGFGLDFGVRAGTEIHFGFIGLPNLALQASVGLFLSVQKIKADGGGISPKDRDNPVDAWPKTTYEESSTDFFTTARGTPWGIFENSVSALYYF